MASLFKKLTTVLLAVGAALCLSTGILFTVQRTTAFAEDDTNTAELNDVKYFTVSNSGVLSGLSQEGIDKAGSKNIAIVIPSTVSAIAASNSATEGILGNLSSKLVSLTIPARVTEIGNYAFYGSTNLKTLDTSAASALATIGANAFNSGSEQASNSLEVITVPAGVTSIGEKAFANRTGLKTINFYATECADFSATGSANPFYRAGSFGTGVTVNIGNSDASNSVAVNKIPANMFLNDAAKPNKITTVNFMLASIGEGKFGAKAFSGCRALATVDFKGSKIAEIGADAFNGCSALTQVAVPASVTELGANAFSGCTSLNTVTLSANLQTIGDYAFRGCKELGNVTIPENVTEIGVGAFQNCESFTVITVPVNVEKLGSNAFYGCTSAKTINYFAADAEFTGAQSSPFANGASGVTLNVGNGTTEVTGLSSHLFRETKVSDVTLNKVKLTGEAEVRNNIFTSCTSLRNVTFNDCKLDVIDFAAFYGCTSLTSIDLTGTGVTKISKQAFYGCTSLTSVTLPETLETIEEKAFENCSSLYKVTVPQGVTSIGDEAFFGCLRLIEVHNLSSLEIVAKSDTHGGIAENALNVYKTGDGNIKTDSGYVFYVDGATVYLITYVGNATQLVLPVYGANGYTVYHKAFAKNADITSVKLASGAVVNRIENEAFAGCTALASVDLTGGPATMGDYVFQNCTALSEVKLPAKLNSVGMYAFDGCVNLSAIEIPANVEAINPNAFQNCTSLSRVTFAADSKLNLIGGSAFLNCGRLSVLNLPSSVRVIRNDAFAGCSGLRTVYLPAQLTTVENSVFPVSGSLNLIAPDKTAYDSYLSGSLSRYGSSLTYKVQLELVYECLFAEDEDADTAHVDYRLYGRNYEWVEQADGSWLPNGGLPVQHGYTQSVWYRDEACEFNVLDENWLTLQLLSGSEKVTIYANTVKAPSLTAADNLKYNSTMSASWTNLVKETADDLGNMYQISITGYKTYYTQESKEVPKNLEAGYYTVTVTLAEKYGAWTNPFNKTVVVEPNDTEASIYLEWVQYPTGAKLGAYNEKDEALTTKLYIYSEGGKDVPYLAKQEKDGKVIEPKQTIEVQSSHVSYTGSAVTIVLSHDSRYFSEAEYYTVVGSYNDNSKNDIGVHTTTVTIAANNNYRFNTEEIKERGLRVTHIAGTNTYTVTKTWYIAVNKSNAPLLGGSEYTEGQTWTWTYNSGKAPTAPKLVSGSEETLITFTLYRYPDTTRSADVLSGNIAENAKYSQFDYYVNDSMPAGRYTLTVNVKTFINDDGDSMAGGAYEYSLNVNYAFNNGSLNGNLNNYKDEKYAQSYAFDGKAYFGDVSSLAVLGKDASELHPQAIGFWALPENKYMYEGFGITFDIVAAQYKNDGSVSYPASTGKYYSADEYKAMYAEDSSVVVPLDIGLYRVYYNVSAPSYGALFPDVTNQSSRESYFFTIKVYGVVNRSDLPEVTSVDYTGSSVTPYVNDKNGWFDVQYLDPNVRGNSADAIKAVGSDLYVDAGTHSIALVIKEAYRKAGLLVWSDDVNAQPNANKTVYYAVVPFRITPARNEAGSLYFNGWNWGKFDTESDANRPVWSTKYVDYDGFTFTLTSETGKVYTYGDKKAGFENADAGTYTLRAYAVGNTLNTTAITGYNWYECSAEIKVTILPATISWDSAPYVLSWKYGDYKKMFSVTEGVLNSAYGKLKDSMKVYYCLASDIDSADPSKRYASINSLLQDGELPAGSYALVYELAETANYDKWVYPVHFSVLKADNYWDITPTVTGWYYGDAAIDYETYKPAYAPHVGDKSAVKISYRMLDENYAEASGWQPTLAQLGLDGNGKLPVGNYELKAEMPETGNYDSMEFLIRFTVSKAQNSWTDIPSVVSWSEGRWKADKNAFVAADMYGSTVYISVEDMDGNVIIERQKMSELNVNTLKALSVGSYKLTAYVDETYDHEGLTSVAYFAVLEDSVGMTGLIAATMVFAVIAIGLAVGSAVLLIRRNKKVEEEFRNLIKSELHRR